MSSGCNIACKYLSLDLDDKHIHTAYRDHLNIFMIETTIQNYLYSMQLVWEIIVKIRFIFLIHIQLDLTVWLAMSLQVLTAHCRFYHAQTRLDRKFNNVLAMLSRRLENILGRFSCVSGQVLTWFDRRLGQTLTRFGHMFVIP